MAPAISARIVNPNALDGVYSHDYLSGNVTTAWTATTRDNWLGVEGSENSEKSAMRLGRAAPSEPVSEQSADDASSAVLAFGGASYPIRDAHDSRNQNGDLFDLK